MFDRMNVSTIKWSITIMILMKCKTGLEPKVGAVNNLSRHHCDCAKTCGATCTVQKVQQYVEQTHTRLLFFMFPYRYSLMEKKPDITGMCACMSQFVPFCCTQSHVLSLIGKNTPASLIDNYSTYNENINILYQVHTRNAQNCTLIWMNGEHKPKAVLLAIVILPLISINDR